MSKQINAAIDTVTGKASFDQSNVPDLHGKVAVVTGGTGGIGFEVAKAFALSRARVILLSRKSEHGDDAIAKIKESADSSVDVEFIECDLGSLANVKEVADGIRTREKRLDLLVADAGVGVNKFDLSADGIDRHFSVNVLGHVMLYNRLLPLMRETSRLPDTPPPRIVSVSSSLHQAAPSSVRFASLDEINDPNLSANTYYARSKLAVMLFTKFGLVDHVIRAGPGAGENIYALATHPGAVHTGQQDQFKEAYGPLFGTVMKAVVVPFMRSPDQGSLSTLWAATSDEVIEKNLQGVYVTDPGKWGGETEQGKNAELGENLWNLCHTIIEEKLGKDGLLPWNEGRK